MKVMKKIWNILEVFHGDTLLYGKIDLFVALNGNTFIIIIYFNT